MKNINTHKHMHTMTNSQARTLTSFCIIYTILHERTCILRIVSRMCVYAHSDPSKHTECCLMNDYIEFNQNTQLNYPIKNILYFYCIVFIRIRNQNVFLTPFINFILEK